MEIYRLAISTLLLLAVIIWFGMFFRAWELLKLDKIEEAIQFKAKMDILTYVLVFLLGMNIANYINKLLKIIKIMANKKTSQSGIGFTGLLCLVFIVLKLTHVIDWSWWWVLSPIWGVFAIAVLVIFLWLIWILIQKIRR